MLLAIAIALALFPFIVTLLKVIYHKYFSDYRNDYDRRTNELAGAAKRLDDEARAREREITWNRRR
ncbi:MAG: hypothetical protein K6E39_02520 [Lachnospiraceae bacterium]|nr:hypothetical protein [Lachnospiraceae bacterium]